MPLDKYNLHKGSHGPSTVELQTFLNEKFDAGLDEGKFGKFGPKTEAAVNKVLETIGMNPDGIFGPDAYAAALKHLQAKEASGYAMPDGPGMVKEAMAPKDSDKPEMM